jgi:hypothetical protein
MPRIGSVLPSDESIVRNIYTLICLKITVEMLNDLTEFSKMVVHGTNGLI